MTQRAWVVVLAPPLLRVALGGNVLRTLLRGGWVHLRAHQRGPWRHVHPHVHARAEKDTPDAHHGLRAGPRPARVGMLHGLAGSAALMLLVLATIPSPAARFADLAVFGIGSTGGMLCRSALLGLPFQLTAQRFQRADVAVRTLAGLVGLGLGVLMAYRIGVIEGLFL